MKRLVVMLVVIVVSVAATAQTPTTAQTPVVAQTPAATQAQTAVSAPATANASAAANAQGAKYVTALADAYMEAYYARFPEAATYAGVAAARHDRLNDNSPEALARWRETQDAFLTLIRDVDADALWGTPEWITYGFLRETLEASRGTRVCRSELWGVNQLSGWHIRAADLAAVQPVGTPESRQAALTRFSAIPRWVEQEIAHLREGLRTGYTAPRPNVRLVIEQLDKLLATPAASSPFASGGTRANDPELAARWNALVEGAVYGAIRQYRDFLRDEYVDKARESIAVTALPNGLDCYRASYRAYSTLTREPQEISDLGSRTVAANQERMRALGKQLFGTSDLARLQKRIREDQANRFSSREELQRFAEEAVARGRAASPKFFRTVPKADVVVKPIPEYREQSASDSYQRPADDGSRPGTYHIKLYKPEEQQRGVVERTAFHETWPGHHLQIALAQERAKAHPITRFVGNSGFSEGWARYSEALAEELGIYATPYGRVGRLGWPARGMVVDPGIHVFGWTREQAVEFILAAGTVTRENANSMVDRIAVWPAQLTAYDSGGLEMFALRAEAERTLGEKFDLREFHDVMLGDGSVTLPMLRAKVERWLRSR